MATDAIVLLKEDHKKVQQLFKRFEGLGPNASKTKKEIADKIVEELSVHSGIEEQIFYPAAREVLEDDSMVLEDLEEHHIMKWTLSELHGMRPEDERFDAKVIHTHTFPLAEVPTAIKYARERIEDAIKVVVKIREN